MSSAARSSSSRKPFGVRGATHDYSGVVVLRDVDFELTPGAVHGLVGENGSGKSTLVKVLTGVIQPTHGEIYHGSEAIELPTPAEAQHRGIGVVHQDYQLFPQLTVAENVYGLSSSLPRRGWMRTVDYGAMRAAVTEGLRELGIELSPRAPAGTLGPAEKKFVEIARAMLRKPDFLILDEPTASLEPKASQAVLDLIGRLRSQGVGLCLISHRLDEVLSASDQVTVLRDGRRIAIHQAAELDEAALVSMIVSEEGSTPAPPMQRSAGRPVHVGAPALKITDLKLRGGARPLNFEVRRGEVLGLSGLLGSGSSQIVRMIAGADADGLRWGSDGELEIDGRRAQIRTPADATRLRIGYIPEDRKGLGLIPDASVATNIALASLDGVSRWGLLNKTAIAEQANTAQEAMSIRCASIGAAVKTLSGGNQQKVLIARWIFSGSKVLAVEEPTHAVDVGGKAQILQLLRAFADRGGAIVVASTEARDLLELCDRVVVLHHGEAVDVLETHDIEASGTRSFDERKERLEQIMVGQAGGVVE